MTTNEKLKEYKKILSRSLGKADDWYIYDKFQELFSYELTGGYYGKDKNSSGD